VGQHTGVGARGGVSRGEALKGKGYQEASSGLNEEQLSAAHHPARAPLMVLAGMCVCVCVCVCTHAYTHTHTHTYTHTHTHKYIHTYIHTYMPACIRTYIHTYSIYIRTFIQAPGVARQRRSSAASNFLPHRFQG
jgi:hypothetical protein